MAEWLKRELAKLFCVGSIPTLTFSEFGHSR